MQVTIEGWDPVDRQPVRGVLQGLDRAQTQAAEQVTVALSSSSSSSSVTLKQNPTLLHARSSTRVGAAVWDGAYVLAAWLGAQPPGSFTGLRCVELGCGLGLPGLLLARLGAAAVFLTDKPALLVGARGNAARNKLLAPQPQPGGHSSSPVPQQQQPGCVVQVVGLDWEQPASLAAAAAAITAGGRVDLLVASDCIYPDPDGSVPSSSGFMAAVTALATPGHTRVLTTFEARSDALRQALLAAAAAVQPCGCEVVRLPLDQLPQGFRGEHVELYELRLPGAGEAT